MRLTAAAKDDGFVLRGYVTRADSAGWTPLDSVGVSITAAGDSATAVRFTMLHGDAENATTGTAKELRAMIYGKTGKYMLTLDREGFNPVVREFERKYKDQSVVWLGTIQMEPERHKSLKEVEVVGTAIKMVMRGDTIVYDAAAFNLADGSMLEALIRQLPNTEMDANGQIKVNSEAGTGGEWRNGWYMPGDARLVMEGVDYLYDDSKKLRVNGNVVFSHERYDSRSESWTNTMRSYAFVSVMWRFNRHPKKQVATPDPGSRVIRVR